MSVALLPGSPVRIVIIRINNYKSFSKSLVWPYLVFITQFVLKCAYLKFLGKLSCFIEIEIIIGSNYRPNLTIRYGTIR